MKATVRPAGIRSRAARALVFLGGGGLLTVALTGCGSANADSAPAENTSFPLAGKVLTIDSDDSAVELVAADVPNSR